tara:strand:- start:378 stop:668 length:291 start_codon:yes stop_codon:yes gene_type:complete
MDGEYRKKECLICLDEFGNKEVAILECMHKYHYRCLVNWLSYSEELRCPECREFACIVCVTPGIEVNDIEMEVSSETTSDTFQEIEEKKDCCCIIS